MPSMEDLKITVQVARVLATLLSDPTGEHYGLTVMQSAKLASGSLYPILRRLEAAGWVTSSWEAVSREEAGRNRRRYYRLTGEGIKRARQELAELSASTATPTKRRAGKLATS